MSFYFADHPNNNTVGGEQDYLASALAGFGYGASSNPLMAGTYNPFSGGLQVRLNNVFFCW